MTIAVTYTNTVNVIVIYKLTERVVHIYCDYHNGWNTKLSLYEEDAKGLEYQKK